MLHQNLHGWPGDPYSLWDNLWVFEGDGFFIAPRTGWYLLTGCGGGGGGGGADNVGGSGGGGGGGAHLLRAPIFLYEGQIVYIKIGAAGVGGNQSAGTAGGGTEFGSIVILGGGNGGLFGDSVAAAGGSLGLITSNLLTVSLAINNATNGGTGTNANGGGGPGFPDKSTRTAGVDHPLLSWLLNGPGVPGQAQTSDGVGYPGLGYGVGGGGAKSNSTTNRPGGNGTRGLLILEMPMAA